MARASPVQYKMYFRVSFEIVIRGHHVYKQSLKPEINQVLNCEEDKGATMLFIVSKRASHVALEKL